ncbi:hypothetical protein GG344DRAFT_84803 [Lentinula edodes]|nr:hypothetical protein GG344DRAFT_84803 [Lentinula edodes]
MPDTMDKTFGTLYISIVIAGLLLGTSLSQGIFYYTTQNDDWKKKLLVAVVLFMDIVHQVLISYTGELVV